MFHTGMGRSIEFARIPDVILAYYEKNREIAPEISILIGTCFGIWNGYLVSYWTVPPFIVSMASMNISKGIASVFTKTQSVSWPQGNDPSGKGWFRNLVKVGDFPVGLLIFAVAIVTPLALTFARRNRINQFMMGLLVVHGALDAGVPAAVARRAAAAMPHAELLVVPDAAHWVQRDRPEVVVPAMRAFLDGLR